jgi:hypothetical protein
MIDLGLMLVETHSLLLTSHTNGDIFIVGHPNKSTQPSNAEYPIGNKVL